MRAEHLLFFDTEFTSLGESGPPELLSAALCDIDGRPVFYMETDDYDPFKLSDFTRSQVVPLLRLGNAPRGSYIELCDQFFAAISSFGHPCALAIDSQWDWLWAQLMARKLSVADRALMIDDPRGFPLWPSNLCPEWIGLPWDALSEPAASAAEKTLQSFWASKPAHHALHDAQAHALATRAALSAKGFDYSATQVARLFGSSPSLLEWSSS